jgi:RNA polymerase sigma-70 factor (ECF subfamily)
LVAKPSLRPQLASVHPLPRPRLSDSALVAAAVAGRPGAAELVWDRFAPLVRGLVRRSLGPDRDADDHVQEVFLRLFAQLEQLRDPTALRSFVVGITVRVLRDELRRRRVRRWLRLTDEGELPDDPAEPRDDAAREALRRLYRILDDGDAEARLAFTLRFVEGLELTEVAAALGDSLATVKRRLAKVTVRVLAAAKNDPVLSSYLADTRGGSDA